MKRLIGISNIFPSVTSSVTKIDVYNHTLISFCCDVTDVAGDFKFAIYGSSIKEGHIWQ